MEVRDFQGMWVSANTFSDFLGTVKSLIFEEQNVIFEEQRFRGNNLFPENHSTHIVDVLKGLPEDI